MKSFALLFRMDISNSSKPSPERMAEYMQSWNEWIGSIEDEGHLETGNHFSPDGIVLKAGNTRENAPFQTDGVAVAGYIVISALDTESAIRIAEKCPILNGENTSVEIRALASPGQ